MLLHIEPKVQRVLGAFALEEEVVAVQVDRRPCICMYWLNQSVLHSGRDARERTAPEDLCERR